jgi:hypothetical protein
MQFAVLDCDSVTIEIIARLAGNDFDQFTGVILERKISLRVKLPNVSGATSAIAAYSENDLLTAKNIGN